MLRVGMSDGPPRFGMFLGAGMLHRAVDLTHQSFPEGRSQGVLGASLMTALLVARTAFGNRHGVLTPDKMRFARDGVAEAPGETLIALATTLDLVGDKWSLVIVRDMVVGKKRFGEFLDSPEGITTNILANRLRRMEKAGLVFSGKHPVHPIMQILELPRDVHPYFVAGQYHPELTSRPLRPQPMFVGLVAAALNRQAAEGTAEKTELSAD